MQIFANKKPLSSTFFSVETHTRSESAHNFLRHITLQSFCQSAIMIIYTFFPTTITHNRILSFSVIIFFTRGIKRSPFRTFRRFFLRRPTNTYRNLYTPSSEIMYKKMHARYFLFRTIFYRPTIGWSSPWMCIFKVVYYFRIVLHNVRFA